MLDRFKIETTPILLVIALVLMLGLLTGCLPEDEIRVHRVPKARSGLESLRKNAPTGSETVNPTDRMVVGLYDLPEATWFFKINGSIEQVKQAESQWRPFLESLRFENGEPNWKLPDGWTEGSQRPMRFATLVIGDQTPPLEMAVSNLGPGQDLLLNVNRWRGQMGLAAVTAAELDGSITKMNLDSVSAWIFDVEGKQSGSMAPFANRPMLNDSQPVPASASGAANDVRFESPAGWDRGKTSGMVPVRLQRTVGEKNAQITVIPLPAAANEWDPNVERWARELGLSGLSKEELAARTSQTEVDSSKGNLLRLVEPNNEKATIGGMFKSGDTAWFVKLTGDREVVSQNEETFSKFLQSLKFPSPN